MLLEDNVAQEQVHHLYEVICGDFSNGDATRGEGAPVGGEATLEMRTCRRRRRGRARAEDDRAGAVVRGPGLDVAWVSYWHRDGKHRGDAIVTFNPGSLALRAERVALEKV